MCRVSGSKYSSFFEESKYLKSHIYHRIADILTGFYTMQGKLPETHPQDPALVFTKVEYIFDHTDGSVSDRIDNFCITGTYKFSDGRTILIYKTCLDSKEMIREVWQYLDRAEKTELMATVLGAKDGMENNDI